MDESASKTCTKCQRALPLEAFGRRLDGRTPRCRECLREADRATYRAANPGARTRATGEDVRTRTAKRCSPCGRVLPLEAFARNARAGDGLRSVCRECQAQARGQLARGAKAALRVNLTDTTKRCLGPCGRELPLEQFSPAREGVGGRHSRCKECNAKNRRQRYAADPEAFKAADRQRYAADPEAGRAAARLWREANPEAQAATARRFRDANRDAMNERDRRNYRELAARMWAHYGPGGRAECWCCGTTERLTIDHIDGEGKAHRMELFGVQASGSKLYKWLAREGLPEGYQTLCLSCNLSKGKADRCQLPHGAEEPARAPEPRQAEPIPEDLASVSKPCTKCGRMLPLARFTKAKLGRYGRRVRCRECEAEDRRQAREANPEAQPAYKARYVAALTAKVRAHYGPGGRPECWCCGSADRLSIDHANGDGKAHRKQVKTGPDFYAWLVREGLPEGYQTLCMPCNQSKGRGKRCTLRHG